MSSGSASSSERRFDLAQDGDRHDGFWLLLVGSVDAVLRAYYGIYEFTDDPACLLRLARDTAREPVTLADGTQIRCGETVGALHLWNDHLRPYANGGPDLGWACDMRRRLVRSFEALADHVERNPDWQAVRAFRGDATLSRRLGNRQVGRLAERYGFEPRESPSTMLRRLRLLGDCFNTWALTRAFNPGALKRQGFLRSRCELWISRDMLLERYGTARFPGRRSPLRPAAAPGVTAAARAGAVPRRQVVRRGPLRS